MVLESKICRSQEIAPSMWVRESQNWKEVRLNEWSHATSIVYSSWLKAKNSFKPSSMRKQISTPQSTTWVSLLYLRQLSIILILKRKWRTRENMTSTNTIGWLHIKSSSWFPKSLWSRKSQYLSQRRRKNHSQLPRGNTWMWRSCSSAKQWRKRKKQRGIKSSWVKERSNECCFMGITRVLPITHLSCSSRAPISPWNPK